MRLLERLRQWFSREPAAIESTTAGAIELDLPVGETTSSTCQPSPSFPPRAAEIPLTETEQVLATLEHLQNCGLRQVTFLAGDDLDPESLRAAAARAVQGGMAVGIRGRGSVLAEPQILDEIAAVGTDRLDVLFLSAIAEIHDALAGGGDCRAAKEVFQWARQHHVEAMAHLAVVPATWKVIEGTLEFLAAQGVVQLGLYAVTVPDASVSPWVFSISQLAEFERWTAEHSGRLGLQLLWHPPQPFDPVQSLAAQVRRGPAHSAPGAIRFALDGTTISAAME